MYFRSSRGFSLIELSIVLVIIGMMVGAVVGGRALVRQAELQAVIKEINGFKTIWNTFKMQYAAWPGDFKEASSYWSGAHNGDGNSNMLNTIPYNEQFQAWEHLSLAEMLPGTYTGRETSDNYARVGVNSPPSKIKGGSYFIWTPDPNSAYGDQRLFGRGGTGTAFLNYGGENLARQPEKGIVTAAETKSLDLKMDDGNPGKGLFIGRKSWSDDGNTEQAGCVSHTFNAPASSVVTYTLSDTTKSCNFGYWLE